MLFKRMVTQYRHLDQKDNIMKINKVPIYILLMFTAIYMLYGSGKIWSGLYFVANYAIMFFLFIEQKDKWVRILGCSLSLCILLFSILKFFISLDQENLNYFNIIIFSLIAFSMFKLEPKE